MHKLGQLPLLLLVLVVVVQGASAYNLIIDRVGGNVSVTVTPIQETFYGKGKVAVAVFNNLNESVNVSIDSKTIPPSDNNFEVAPKDSHIVEFEFKKSFSGQFRYVISSSTFQKIAYQDVNVEVKGASLSFTKEVTVTVEEKSITRKFVTFINTGDVPLDVKIDVTGDSVLAAVPSSFTLDEGESLAVAYIIYGKNDTVNIPVTYEYDNEKEVVMQKFVVKTTPMKELVEKEKEVIEKEKKLKDYENMLKKLRLEGTVKFQVPDKGVVNKPVIIRGYLNGKPIEDSLVLVKTHGYSDVLVMSGGAATFTPEKAGEYTVSLINGYGDTVASDTIKIQRANWNISIGEQTVGQPFTVLLPEIADVKVTKNGRVVFSGSGQDRYNITISEPGEYKFSFVGSAYQGSTTFRVTGTVSLTLMQGNKVITPGQTVTAGTPIKIAATIGGAPIPGKMRVSYPANAFGYDSKDIQVLMMQQMFMQMYLSYYGNYEGGNSTGLNPMSGMMFVPPNNILVEYPLSNGAGVIPLPDRTSGYVTVIFMTQDGEIAGQYTFKVNPKTPLGGYEPYVATGSLLFLAVVVLSKVGVIPVPSRLKVKLEGIKDKLKRGSADLPDLE